MLFTSAIFVFAYLPVTIVVFFVVGRFNRVAAAIWLAVASIFFYGWWDYRYVPLLAVSIVFNFVMSRQIAAAQEPARRKLLLAIAVTAALGLLAYFKYKNFLLSVATDQPLAAFRHLVIPLGISFYTFTQIAFLVDTYRREAHEPSFVHYVLFVTYFPHLIAGPIIHHKEMMPQFRDPSTYSPQLSAFSEGAMFFVIGLFKKAVIADGVAPFADALFGAAGNGHPLGLAASWAGALAYTAQIYFDFSGYSDMAIGLSLLFGIRLPLNFASPYQSTNIIEFWRRWHMTLSRFLRDYLYISLGGNRKGPVRRYLNLFLTMLLGGLWHGAGWTFVIWGALHGTYLMVNHAWHALSRAARGEQYKPSRVGKFSSWLVTFLVVVVAWVFFRADTVASAAAIVVAMFGFGSFDLTADSLSHALAAAEFWWIAIPLALALVAPNSQDIVARASAYLTAASAPRREAFAFVSLGAIAVVVPLCVAIAESKASPVFIYFNF